MKGRVTGPGAEGKVAVQFEAVGGKWGMLPTSISYADPTALQVSSSETLTLVNNLLETPLCETTPVGVSMVSILLLFL